MRITILGVADDIRQADLVLRALDRIGLTIDDVQVLLACADERAPEQRPVVCLNVPDPLRPQCDVREEPGAGFINIHAQATIQGAVIVAARADRLGQRSPTVTGNARIELPLPSGVVRDLHGLGIALQEARRIGAVVRMDNVLILVEERPGCSGDAIIDAMLGIGLSKVFMVAEAEEPGAARHADGSATRDGTSADRLPWTSRWNQPYF